MNQSNLPPGCSESDIPGNRPEDVAWDNLLDEIAGSGLDIEEARRRWISQPDLLEAAKMFVEDGSIIGRSLRLDKMRAAVAKAQEAAK